MPPAALSRSRDRTRATARAPASLRGSARARCAVEGASQGSASHAASVRLRSADRTPAGAVALRRRRRASLRSPSNAPPGDEIGRGSEDKARMPDMSPARPTSSRGPGRVLACSGFQSPTKFEGCVVLRRMMRRRGLPGAAGSHVAMAFRRNPVQGSASGDCCDGAQRDRL